MTINLCRGKRIIQIVLSFFVLPTAFSEVTDSFDEYYDDYQEYYDDIQSNHNYLGDKLDLGTLRGNNSGDSEINALSADGKIAGGRAEHNSGDTHAAIWFGHNWKDKLDLGTLSRDNSGHSEIKALSSDGKIAGGWASNNSDSGTHAAIWFGHNWKHKLDLGTLKRDNSGTSQVTALSADGKTVAGISLTDSGEEHAFVSRIDDSGVAPNECQPAPVVASPAPPSAPVAVSPAPPSAPVVMSPAPQIVFVSISTIVNQVASGMYFKQQ
ncbi:hypothetical protein [Candidatus Williamhamiltonella defendens]|uniref:hypothetical protein n=1 Tax=Candidatus Williamhamiltonella defendens TaxID=138072 RepID=UPI00158383B0|nr:hypothetical protein [Candidatus Hamiltonella defensa]